MCKGAEGTEGKLLCYEMGTHKKIVGNIRQKDSLLLIWGKRVSLNVRDQATLNFWAGTYGGVLRNAVYPFTRVVRIVLNRVFSNFRTRL